MKNSTAIVVLAEGHDPPPLEEIGKPGTVSMVIDVEAGGLAAFEANATVRACLRNGVPVVAVFEDEVEARELRLKLVQGWSA